MKSLRQKTQQKTFALDPFNIYKMFDGKKYQFIGGYPKNNQLIWDIKRIYKKHGLSLKIETIENNSVRLWKRK